MPLDGETLAKLTTTLAGETDLYNKVMREIEDNESALAAKEQEIQATKDKLEKAEEQGQKYLGQISNLLSKIPIGSSPAPQSLEEKLEEIKQRSWTK